MAAGFTDRMIDRAYNMSVETLLGRGGVTAAPVG